MSNDNNNFEIDIIPNQKLENKKIVTKFIKNIKHNYIKLDLNHKYTGISPIIISTSNIKNWSKFHDALDKEFERKGIHDKGDINAVHDTVDDNHERIAGINEYYSDDASSVEGKVDENNQKIKEIAVYKYSKMGREPLHEAVIVNDLPFFIKYDHYKTTFELVENIPENSRILRPPHREEYPYTPYEFESNEELEFYMQKAREITLDELYKISKNIFFMFIDQDKHIIILLAADSIWTYFQDLFSITHYIEAVGTNDVGKSSMGYTFEYTGYRVIKGTSISGANYNRILGSVEPGQCTIIEDEGDNISEDPDKVRLLKAGYEYNTKVPKINMNTTDQEPKWYFPFSYKMILAEKSLKEYKVPGLVDRTFTNPFRPGNVKYSIKEVVSQNINKNPRLQILYDHLLSFRKLMLCYRLVHYKDQLTEIETGLKNRDNELCKPLLQLFYGTKTLQEIKETLEIFVKNRRSRKKNSLEAALYPIIKKFVFKQVGLDSEQDTYTDIKVKKNKTLVKVPFWEVWEYIKESGIDGHYDEKKKYAYETIEYGSLYLNSLPTFISNKFTAEVKKQNYGKALLFDIEKLERFEDLYSDSQLKEENVKIEVKEYYVSEEKGDNYDNYDDFLGAYLDISEKKVRKIGDNQDDKIGFDEGIEHNKER